MGLYNEMKTNPKLENEGVWLEVEDTRIRLARAGGSNMAYNTAMEKIAREHKRVIDLGLMSSKKGMELLHGVFAETVVKEWETRVDNENVRAPDDEHYEEFVWKPGISGPAGELIPFTEANVIQTFIDLPSLFILCRETSTGLQAYRQALLDGIVKN